MRYFYQCISFVTILLLGITLNNTANAQESDNNVEYITKDNTKYKIVGSDTIKIDHDIYTEINSGKGKICINQSNNVAKALAQKIETNAGKPISGFRIRIYFDNKQTARNRSQTVLEEFEEMFPNIPAYRSYKNPYFTVTVGNFLTKSEAVKALELIKPQYPNAIVLKEKIK